jgi:hypothetical protein
MLADYIETITRTKRTTVELCADTCMMPTRCFVENVPFLGRIRIVIGCVPCARNIVLPESLIDRKRSERVIYDRSQRRICCICLAPNPALMDGPSWIYACPKCSNEYERDRDNVVFFMCAARPYLGDDIVRLIVRRLICL